MRAGPRLPRAFFARPATTVAPELLGALLLHRLPDGPVVGGRIVEVEAYLGDGSDPAAHSHAGPTARNRTMFGPPGRLYAYRSYGVHTCVNVVCERAGIGAAVLLRALEPVGEETALAAMRALRGLASDAPLRDVARGPGRLGQALGFDLAHDGASLLRGPVSLHAPLARPRVVRGPRVGITKAAGLPYRFFDADSRFVSAFRPGRARSR